MGKRGRPALSAFEEILEQAEEEEERALDDEGGRFTHCIIPDCGRKLNIYNRKSGICERCRPLAYTGSKSDLPAVLAARAVEERERIHKPAGLVRAPKPKKIGTPKKTRRGSGARGKSGKFVKKDAIEGGK